MSLVIIVLALVVLFFFMRGINKHRAGQFRRREQYRISEDKVADEWTALLEKGADKADAVMDKIARAIRDANVSGVSVSKKTVAFGRDTRPFVVVEHDKLTDYCMYIGALPSGNRLNVVWYLTFYSPAVELAKRDERASRGMASAMRTFGGELGRAMAPEDKGPSHFVPVISMLDKLELTNYVSLVHNIVVEETKAMMDELQLDASRLKTGTAKGFLTLA
jgi:hypothetical protein